MSRGHKQCNRCKETKRSDKLIITWAVTYCKHCAAVMMARDRISRTE